MAAKLTLADRLAARSPQGALARAQKLKQEGQQERAFKLFSIAAAANLPEALSEVGLGYLTGLAGVRNIPEAARWLTRAAEAGDTPAQLALSGLYSGGYRASTSSASGSLFGDSASAEGENAAGPPDYENALKWAQRAAESGKGDGEAEAVLGYVYLMAPPPLRDEEKAAFWYTKAVEAGKPQGHLGLGLLTLAKATTDEPTFRGVEHIRKAAEAGLPTGHLYMAIIYERAIGLLPDPEKIAFHYGEAAKANIRAAQAKYGMMLFNGIGIKPNKTEGETWLRRAGLAGDAEAAMTIANHYAKGDDKIDPNYTEAAMWFRIAADAGRADAARALGMIYLLGASVARDPDEAARWFRRAAEAGDPQAQADLAMLMIKGQTNPRFTATAPVHEWFETAATEGDLVGAYNYAVCLAEGIGVERDDTKAAEWFRKAAVGVLNAQYQLARFLMEGRGVAQDFVEARAWLKQAADMNLPEALMAYPALLAQGLGGERDDAAASVYFRRAAELHGNPDAMFALGALYGGGHQVETDRAVSLSWYRQAAEKGHPRAALMLGKYLRFGIATPVDIEAARKWLSFARDKGIEEAAADLAALDAPPAPEGAA